eukprot:scaffold16282_cov151-Skeletonema_marinoi.AAC.1
MDMQSCHSKYHHGISAAIISNLQGLSLPSQLASQLAFGMQSFPPIGIEDSHHTYMYGRNETRQREAAQAQ